MDWHLQTISGDWIEASSLPDENINAYKTAVLYHANQEVLRLKQIQLATNTAFAMYLWVVVTQ